ncbi:unnamed protein product [Strongylus vulgaris]|uniref:Uncharacterized protein n=1 Tax=Strongylus vulgaris TaxID=40348 RepID=A0A3P7J244_STRVU|nr:unnamed protein product [Strongylus vulgaris]
MYALSHQIPPDPRLASTQPFVSTSTAAQFIAPPVPPPTAPPLLAPSPLGPPPAPNEETEMSSGQGGSIWSEMDRLTFSEQDAPSEAEQPPETESAPHVLSSVLPSRYDNKDASFRTNRERPAWLTEDVPEWSRVEQPMWTDQKMAQGLQQPPQQPQILPNLTWWQPPKSVLPKQPQKQDQPESSQSKPRELAAWQVKMLSEIQQSLQSSGQLPSNGTVSRQYQQQESSERQKRSSTGWKQNVSSKWHLNALCRFQQEQPEPIQSIQLQQRGPNEEVQKIFFRWQPNVRNKIKPKIYSDGHQSIPIQLPQNDSNNWRPSGTIEVQHNTPNVWLPNGHGEVQNLPGEWQVTGSNDWQEDRANEFQPSLANEAHKKGCNDWQPTGDSAWQQNAFSGFLQNGPGGLQVQDPLSGSRHLPFQLILVPISSTWGGPSRMRMSGQRTHMVAAKRNHLVATQTTHLDGTETIAVVTDTTVFAVGAGMAQAADERAKKVVVAGSNRPEMGTSS